ncbi:hypothetical protein [Agromyces sp. NPDC057865]|uniref:hypothetical protein n=1 Tax=Agromyces sp. NPDC057865 TaxID=3346267 RepID=UPI00366CA9A6
MTSTDQEGPVAEVRGAPSEPPEHRILRAAAQLAGTAILAGSIATVIGFVLTFGVPVLIFVFMAFPWGFVPLAATSGGLAAGASVVVVRALGWSSLVERLLVPLSAAAGSVPVLLSVSALRWGIPPWMWAAWIVVAVAAALYGYRRTLRHPLAEWRPVLVRLLVGVGLAIGVSAFFVIPFDRSWDGAVPALLVLGGVILLSGILISLGPFRSRTVAGIAWAGLALLVTSVVAVMLGVSLQSEFAREVAPPPPTLWAEDGADRDPRTDLPRDPAEPAVPPPTLEEGRAQFAALAAATIDAAGPDARWRDQPGAVVREVDCGDGTTMLRIDAEFAMGEITDTTTDEQDRTVTEANLAAADRIVLAWSAAGLGTPEVLHGEPILGGAAMSSVDFAKVDFAFGVAQPRIEGRCLPGD